jgi:hypothetical protein
MVEGHVIDIALSGRSPGSGRLIVTIKTEDPDPISLIASVMPNERKKTQVEDVVFVGFTTIATIAWTFGPRVKASYRHDESGIHRPSALNFLPGNA